MGIKDALVNPNPTLPHAVLVAAQLAFGALHGAPADDCIPNDHRMSRHFFSLLVYSLQFLLRRHCNTFLNSFSQLSELSLPCPRSGQLQMFLSPAHSETSAFVT